MTSKQIQVDYIIVGQGIAGTIIAYLLKKRQKKILVIDNNHEGSASMVAAGIVNPITGKKFVKSWRSDELLPLAKSLYRDMEKDLDIEFLNVRTIIRVLRNPEEENSWFARTGDPEYQQYMSDFADVSNFENKIRPFYGYGEVNNGFQVNIGELVKAWRVHLQKTEEYLSENFDHNKLQIIEETYLYKSIRTTQVIFCEGYKGEQNPFFPSERFAPSKGEALIVRIPGADFEKMIKDKVFIVRLYDDIYWVGSGYEWRAENDTPTEKIRKELITHLNEMLLLEYEIIDHRAAIRPSTKNRRPFISEHPVHKGMYFFNGMGTKGTSMAPFFAMNLIAHIEDGEALDDCL
ncbi:MAG: FAD-binding oxidoreductase [Saprospiraceae bacterium]|nr:FAD-binding oxidoreductase [Saprospiraceae bacterium]